MVVNGLEALDRFFVDEEMDMTMIYTEAQSKALAEQAVQRVMDENLKTGKEPLTEAEKDRLWHLVKSACEGE
jgi:hypothetical protein